MTINYCANEAALTLRSASIYATDIKMRVTHHRVAHRIGQFKIVQNCINRVFDVDV